tara:strand:- start:4582 stop:5211 length:630 start_codon:yes stop_codon:yes gene_type:complete
MTTQNKPEVGKHYEGKVKNMLKFGAFVEILPGVDGLVHISNMAPVRVAQPEDILEVGAIIDVKCIEVTEDTLRLTMIDVEQLNEKVANRILRAIAKGDAPEQERRPRRDDRGPRRSFGDKPRGDRPRRDFGDKPRGDRNRDDRPRRNNDDRPRSDRPRKDFGDKPRGPRNDDRKGGRKFGDKPRGDRPRSDKPRGDFKGKPKRSFNKDK